MKNIYLFLTLFAAITTLFTGCMKNHQSNDETAFITDISAEYITQITTKKDCVESFDSYNNESTLLDPRPVNRTIDVMVSEWSDNDVAIAWKMIDASEIYSEYTDRIFLDCDFDQNVEMILTSYSTDRMYLFKKIQNDIVLLDYIEDIDITNGYVFSPPTDEKDICEHDVYDFQECRNFKFTILNNNIYVSGISLRPSLGKTCWIKELTLNDGKIVFSDLYRWGEFRMGEQWMFNFEYRKYNKDGMFEYVQKEEIDDFLLQLN